jgi:hypothetical protein
MSELLTSEDIASAIGDGIVSLIEERDDWRDAHVSDVYGCDYSTHARRGADAKPVQNRDAEGCLKMQLGVDIEGHVAKILVAHYRQRGYEAWRNERIAWNPETGVVRRGMLDAGHGFNGFDSSDAPPCPGCEHCQAQPGEIIGHMDFNAQNSQGEDLLEIKSTALYGRMPSSLPWTLKNGTQKGAHYIEQAANYGVAIGAKRVGVIIVCRDSCKVAGPFFLELDDLPPRVEGIYDPTQGTLREQTIARAKQMLEATNPDNFPPEPRPRYPWQPSFCSLGEACACKNL